MVRRFAGQQASDSRRDQTHTCPATRIPRDGGCAAADCGAAGAIGRVFKLWKPPINNFFQNPRASLAEE